MQSQSFVVTLLLVLTTAAIIDGQPSSQLEWVPEDFRDRNPIIQPRMCGLNSDEAGYICDPNGILGSDVTNINWILKDAAHNSTNCPCSTYYCETEKGPKGYRIGIAIVQRMKGQDGQDGVPVTIETLALSFALRLESDLWNMGNCQEDIVIFYSRDDEMLAIFAGSTAQRKLTPFYAALLRNRVKPYLDEGRVVEGFNNLLYDLKHVLNCDTDAEHGNCGLNELRSGSSSTNPSILLALGVFAISAFISRSV